MKNYRRKEILNLETKRKSDGETKNEFKRKK